jgi:hypothetical protein
VGHRERLVFLLFSDGGENASRDHTMRALLERAEALRDVRIFAIAPAVAQSDVRAMAPLIWLSQATAGRVEFVATERDVPRALASVRERIENEVLVGYAPPQRDAAGRDAGGRDAGARKVRVRIRARDGIPCRVREAAPERTRM